jgi:hypothetical protein
LILREGVAPRGLQLRLWNREGGVELHDDGGWVPLVLILHVLLLLLRVLLWRQLLRVIAFVGQVLVVMGGIRFLIHGVRG